MMQAASPGQFTGLRDCLAQTIKSDGVMGLYKGLSAPLAAQGVYKALIFSANAGMRQVLGGRTDVSVVALSGAAAGVASVAVVTPVELVRNRLMVQSRAEAVIKTATVGKDAGAKAAMVKDIVHYRTR